MRTLGVLRRAFGARVRPDRRMVACEAAAAVVHRAEMLLAALERGLLRLERLSRRTPPPPRKGTRAPTTREGVGQLLEEARSDLSLWKRMQGEAEQVALEWEARARKALAADIEELAMEAVSMQLEWREAARRHAVQRRIAAAHAELVESVLHALDARWAAQGPRAKGHQ